MGSCPRECLSPPLSLEVRTENKNISAATIWDLLLPQNQCSSRILKIKSVGVTQIGFGSWLSYSARQSQRREPNSCHLLLADMFVRMVRTNVRSDIASLSKSQRSLYKISIPSIHSRRSRPGVRWKVVMSFVRAWMQWEFHGR